MTLVLVDLIAYQLGLVGQVGTCEDQCLTNALHRLHMPRADSHEGHSAPHSRRHSCTVRNYYSVTISTEPCLYCCRCQGPGMEAGDRHWTGQALWPCGCAGQSLHPLMCALKSLMGACLQHSCPSAQQGCMPAASAECHDQLQQNLHVHQKIRNVWAANWLKRGSCTLQQQLTMSDCADLHAMARTRRGVLGSEFMHATQR